MERSAILLLYISLVLVLAAENEEFQKQYAPLNTPLTSSYNTPPNPPLGTLKSLNRRNQQSMPLAPPCPVVHSVSVNPLKREELVVHLLGYMHPISKLAINGFQCGRSYHYKGAPGHHYASCTIADWKSKGIGEGIGISKGVGVDVEVEMDVGVPIMDNSNKGEEQDEFEEIPGVRKCAALASFLPAHPPKSRIRMFYKLVIVLVVLSVLAFVLIKYSNVIKYHAVLRYRKLQQKRYSYSRHTL
eukprot:TRINITY_DN1305_c0_g2_i2.p1 TRINITY_DN1305_c0_g2~~TRINITY_DN1305_c0_g2_i2.p1  ORF type:complete len:244 (+),score=30.31 TRINITY_DN1305_c0_g2_i2:283-1014(+)